MKTTELVRRLYSKREIAELIGMSVRSVDSMLCKGMPHLKIGQRRCRFDPDEVLAWVKQQYGTRRLGRANGVSARGLEAA